MTRPHRNFIGVDDAPFAPQHRGDVALVGAFYTGTRLDGVVTGRAERDGSDATDRLVAMVQGCRFNPRVVLLGGIAVGGFNVVDIHALHARTGRAVLVVARRDPDMVAIRAALERVPGGTEKLALIERAGPMEPLEAVWVQRAGLTAQEAARILRETTLHGKVPEPLRVAHLIAGALATGHSRGDA